MQPQPQQSGTPTSDGKGEVFIIKMEALGPDGTAYTAEMDVFFPRGTRITSVQALPAAPPQGK